jgi:hypothetical protein
VHLPDPIAEAIKGLAARITALEQSLDERGDGQPIVPAARVEPAASSRLGPNPAGG